MVVDYWNHVGVARIAFLFCVCIIAFGILSYRNLRSLLVAVGLLQSFYVFGQFFGVLPSRHMLFPITGFMENPGQMGGLQVIALICCLDIMKERKKARMAFICLIVFVSLCLSDSRTGLVAAIAGVLFICRDEFRRFLKQVRCPIIVCSVIVVILIAVLYFYRRDSADARLLIWRVSLDMIVDKPLTGFGPGNFPYHYMLYQADYFIHHPESPFYTVADNVFYPFNEYIKLTTEFGLPGLILFMAAFYILWKYSKSREGFAPLIALLVFGFFSYPSDKLVLASLLPLSIGAILHDNRIFIPVRIRLMAVSLATVAAVCIYASSEIGDSDKYYIGVPNCETWCDLGEACEKSGCYGQAEEYYRTASFMIPTRIRPKYLLWKLYVGLGRYDEALEIAHKILTEPVKVENTFTLRVKDQVRYWCCGIKNEKQLLKEIE